MNPWIDFCVVLENEKDIDDAKEIIEHAYNSWFSAKNQTDEPIMEYVGRRLSEVCIEHEIYFTGKRMSFIEGGGTDSVAYAHYVWRKGYYPEFAKIKVI